MIKRVAILVLVPAALMLVVVSGRGGPSTTGGVRVVGRVEHAVRLFSYQVVVGARLQRTVETPMVEPSAPAASAGACSVPDTVFVVVTQPSGRQR